MIYPAITLDAPSLADMCRPYLAGVLHGDGWCTPLTIGLRVRDRDFSDAFVAALRAATGVSMVSRPDERGYWLCRTSNKTGRFDELRGFCPGNNDETGWWLRGLFDSEGNANLTYQPRLGLLSCSRRIAVYSTREETLAQAAEFMEWLEIPHLIRPTKNSATHKGSKVVHELRVLRREGFARFAEMVGSNIGRKQETIERIVDSYQPPGGSSRNLAKARAVRWRRA